MKIAWFVRLINLRTLGEKLSGAKGRARPNETTTDNIDSLSIKNKRQLHQNPQNSPKS